MLEWNNMITKYFKRIFSLFLFALLSACGSDHHNGAYTVGFDAAWFGMDFVGQQNNVTGFSRDVLKEISKSEKIKFSLFPVSWDVLVPNLKTKQYDAILSYIYPYLFNQSSFEFSEPYLLTGPILVLPMDSTFTSLDELNGMEIATLPDTDASIYLEKNPAILIRSYDSIPTALNDVVAGTIDGAVIDILIATAYCNNIYNGKLKLAIGPFNDEGLRVLTYDKSNSNLIKSFNRGLAKLKKSGTYDALLKKWSLGQ
jgi:polar amino acid transport system substrate-binding protein